MPPAASNLSLTEEEKDLLRRWVIEGAEYKPHWAFQPGRKPVVPVVKDKSKVRNSIDAFVLTRLAKEGLTLSPEASRETLIRRLSFDLRGLPPTLEEIDAFVGSRAPNSYQQLFDKF